MSLPSTQRGVDSTVRTGLTALDERLRAITTPLPAARWSVRRPDGGWSVGEVLEHCCLANDAYLTAMRAALTRAGATVPPAGERLWRPTFMGGLLRKSLEMTFRLPAPGRIQPGPTPRANVLDALLATHEAVRTLMTDAAAHDWTRLRFTSPLSTLVRPNFGDAFLIALRHGERHAGQIERTIALIDR
ncbi:MAG: DinB family protein [Gemmatimonadetes bacterium]|nr:DinB family protein [Gemmatimonadota bacterium]